MPKSILSIQKTILSTFVTIEYVQKRMRFAMYSNFVLQFLQFFILKLLFQKSGLNIAFRNLKQSLQMVLKSNTVPLALNFLVCLLFIFLIISIGIFRQKDQDSEKKQQKCLGISIKKVVIPYGYIFLEHLYVPCLIINAILINQEIPSNNQIYDSLPPFVSALAIINTLLILIGTLIYGQSMLLGAWTLPIVFFSLNFTLVAYPLKIFSILALIVILFRKQCFQKILVGLLLFLFVMDFLSFAFSITIRMLSFGIFSAIFILIVAVRADTIFLTDKIKQNQLLLQMIQKLSNNKRLDKIQQTNLLRMYFYTLQNINEYSQSLKNLTNQAKQPFEPIDVNSLKWLLNYFKIKIEANIKEDPNNITFKLQRFLYQFKHEKLTIQALHDIHKLAKDSQNVVKFNQKVILMQIQSLIEENYLHKDQVQSKTFLNINIGQKIQLFYQTIYQSFQLLVVFWNKFFKKNLSETQMYQIFVNICNKQEEIKELIYDITDYKNTKSEQKVFHYAMSLLNFSYEPQSLKRYTIQSELKELKSSFFICLAQNKITYISKRIVLQLKRQRQQIIGQNFDILIPSQLKTYLRHKLNSGFQEIRDPSEIIFPFLMDEKYILPYKIKIELKFNINLGVQNGIHILKSQDLQNRPTFLYSLNNDQIVYSCPLFAQFLQIHKRKLNSNILATQLFGVDLSQQITQNGKNVNSRIFCALKKQKNHQQNMPITLIIQQIYKDERYCYALFKIELDDLHLNRIPIKLKTIDKFITQIQDQNNDAEQLAMNNQTPETFFCKIPNPYEAKVRENTNKLKSFNRLSYIKIIIFLMIIIFFLHIVNMAFITTEVSLASDFYKNLINFTIKRNLQIQTIYLLFYQYYQHYQIKHFPQQILQIQSYNVASINSQYYKKSNQNVVTLKTSFFNDLVSSNGTYKLEFSSFNTTGQTSSLSLKDFLTDIKQSLNTNNPSFSVRNYRVVQTIISSYKPVQLDTLNNHIAYIQWMILGFSGIIVVITLVILILVIKMRLTSREIITIFSKVSPTLMSPCIQKYKQFLRIGKNLYSSQEQTSQNHFGLPTNFLITKSPIQQAPPSIKSLNSDNNETNSEGQIYAGIKLQSYFSILKHHLYILLIVILSATYYIIFNISIQSYQQNASLILQKTLNLQNSILLVSKQAEAFYRAAMEEILPPNQRHNWTIGQSQILQTSFKTELPQFFNNYLQTQSKILNYNLCSYAYLNNGSLYKNINCSLILNGAMEKSFTEAYILYLQLVSQYGGSPVSKLGEIFRQNAKYPVYMQVSYIRRTINNMLISLQDTLNSDIVKFVNLQNDNLNGNVIKAVLVIPALILSMVFIAKKIIDEGKSIVKCFEILPISFVQNIKVSKFLKKQNILQKIQWIPI